MIKKCIKCNKEIDCSNLLMVDGDECICLECRKELGRKTILEQLEELKINMIYPKEMLSNVSKYVVGQRQAIKTLSVEIRKHFLRITTINSSIKKNNLLLLGPTASGKSYMVERFAKECNLPFISIDITTISPTGYVGDDINSILLRLIKKSESQFMAERGIIFIDEIDKIVENKYNDGIDVRGKMLQQSLLRLIDGDKVSISEQIAPGMHETITVDTSNILFICAGAFVGIEKVIRKRLKATNCNTIGFSNKIYNKNQDDDYYRGKIIAEDLIKYGFIPEMVGRLPVILTLEKLTESQLCEVIKTKGGIIEEYQELFKQEGKIFKMDNSAVELLAKEIYKSEVGARALRGIMSKITDDIFYNINTCRKKTIVISEDIIRTQLNK